MGAAPSSSQIDFDQMDLYEVLDIDEKATTEDIKRAYYKRSREHHPDKNLDDRDGATRRFTRILQAYETLKDDQKRAMYNAARVQKTQAEMNPASSTGGIPGSWSSDDKPESSKTGWFTWLFGWTAYRERFIFKNYLAAVQNRGFSREPGITTQDITKFLKSLPQPLHWKFDDDHSEEGAFYIFDNFFKCLALDELQWGSTGDIPEFGCAHFIWCRDDWIQYGNPFQNAPQVKDFYGFWSNFQTCKDFAWAEPYPIRPGYYDNHSTKQMRQANKRARYAARRNYNERIQTIVKSLLESDPRYRIHQYMEARQDTRPSPHNPQRTNQNDNRNEKKNENNGEKKKKKRKRKRGHGK